MRVTVAVALALSGIVGVTGTAGAQVQRRERLRVSVNAGVPATSRTVKQDFTASLYQEAAPITSDIDVSGGRFADFGVNYRLTRTLWAGVAFSSLSRTVAGTVAASLPHPFYFNQPRAVSGTISDLESKETGVHLSVAYLTPLSRSLDLAVFGGPSRFSITQDLVTDINYDESYPYDTATLTSATTRTVSGSVWGFNVGADLTWRLSKHFGVGGLVRFARASTTLSAAPDNEASVDAGGLSAGGGVRVVF